MWQHLSVSRKQKKAGVALTDENVLTPRCNFGEPRIVNGNRDHGAAGGVEFFGWHGKSLLTSDTADVGKNDPGLADLESYLLFIRDGFVSMGGSES